MEFNTLSDKCPRQNQAQVLTQCHVDSSGRPPPCYNSFDKRYVAFRYSTSHGQTRSVKTRSRVQLDPRSIESDWLIHFDHFNVHAMQMQHVRVSRGPQVPVPPVSATPLELSRELQQQLRVTRHRAFERLQENAQWAKELLNSVHSTDDAFVTTRGLVSSAEELQQQLKAKKQEVDELERQLAQQNEDQQATQLRFEEILAALKAAGSVAALQECEEKKEAEKKLLTNKQRKMEIVRL